jgi:hypothetical protein
VFTPDTTTQRKTICNQLLNYKRKFEVVILYIMTSFGGLEMQLHSLLTSAVYGSEWLALSLGKAFPVPTEYEITEL